MTALGSEIRYYADDELQVYEHMISHGNIPEAPFMVLPLWHLVPNNMIRMVLWDLIPKWCLQRAFGYNTIID